MKTIKTATILHTCSLQLWIPVKSQGFSSVRPYFYIILFSAENVLTLFNICITIVNENSGTKDNNNLNSFNIF